MKLLMAGFVVSFYSTVFQAQTIPRLSDIIPENCLPIINEKLINVDNSSLNEILSSSAFFANNVSTTQEVVSGLVKDFTLQGWNGGSWLNDSTVIYSYNQDNLLFEQRIKNWLGNAWLDNYRYNRYYDSALRLSLIIEQDYANGVWIDSIHNEYNYNSQGQPSTLTTSFLNNYQWENWKLTTFSYNNNFIVQDITKSWNGSGWENSTRVSYSYNSNFYPTNITFSFWLFGIWINLLQIQFNYNSHGLIDEFKLKIWDPFSGWADLTRILFYYDINFNIFESLAQDWDSNTSSWKNYSRIKSTYDLNNLLLTDLKELWSTSNNWINESFKKYSYDGSFNRTQELTQIWNDGNWINNTRELYNYVVTSVEEISELPNGYFLSQNYPNPFNPVTTIKFSIPSSGYATLKIYNAVGKEVSVLVQKEMPKGIHKVEWNASGFSSGVYFYQLKTDEFIETKKMIMLK